MINCIRTNSKNEDFRRLVSELDADLSMRDGEEHSFYARFNKIDQIKYAIVAYDNEKPVACGAIKAYDHDTMEIKRMFVIPGRRGQGIASNILQLLELWAIELNCSKCLLETGKKQPEAMGLYRKNGYTIIPNYGQYENIDNSVCFEKVLKG